MKRSDRKIFFFDLDGTLLTTKKDISPRTMDALKKFTDAGNYFCINTGRAIDSAKAVYRGLGLNFQGSFLCGCNGTEIYSVDEEKYVYKTGVPLELVPVIMDMAKEHDMHCHTYNDTHIVTAMNGECMEYYRRVIKTPLLVTDDVVKELTSPPPKMIAIELHDKVKQENFRKALDEVVGDKLTLLYSSPYYLEIFPKEAGKGNAVKRLADILGVPIENTYAAGDEENDIPMLEQAGIGVATGHATKKLKEVADIVTENDNNGSAVAEVMSALLPHHP